MDKFDKFLWGVVIVAVVALFWIISICVFGANITRQCIEAGYPEYTVTWNYEGYCISWIDATKVVVPLDEIK